MKTHRVYLLLAAAIAAAPLAAEGQVVAPRALPTAASVRTASAAAALLRDLFFKQQYYDGIALGDTLAKRFTGDSRVKAWHVASVAAAGLSRRADSMTAKIDSTSRDPWLLAARSFARHNPPIASRSANAEAVRLARRALTLAQGK